jgi:TetR/AcrR family transcriptional regulator, transcriptional repressor for nem operon
LYRARHSASTAAAARSNHHADATAAVALVVAATVAAREAGTTRRYAHDVKPEPKTARGRATRQRLITDATQLVRERGVEATSLDDVLVASGASKSQLYHYFDDKADLIRAVVAQRATDVVAEYDAALGAVAHPAQLDAFLARVVDDHAAANYANGCPIATLAGELGHRDYHFSGDLARAFTAIDHAFRDAFVRIADAGALPRAGAEDLATTVFALIEGGLLLSKVQGDGHGLTVAVDSARRLVANAAAEMAAAPRQNET